MAAIRRAFPVEFGNYNYKSASFVTKASAIAALGGVLAFLNFVPPATFL